MTAPNRIRDFDPATRAIIGYCGQCGHSAVSTMRREQDHLVVTSSAQQPSA